MKKMDNKMNEPKTLDLLKKEGIEITEEQYDALAFLDLSCKYSCSVYEVLSVLKILKLI